jgi:hypothetical protein
VLEYLRELPDAELTQIRTAGDVYWHSVNHLLKAGMKGSVDARKIGLAPGEMPEFETVTPVGPTSGRCRCWAPSPSG